MTSVYTTTHLQFCLSLLPFPRAYLRPAILHAVKLSQRYVEYKPADDAIVAPGTHPVILRSRTSSRDFLYSRVGFFPQQKKSTKRDESFYLVLTMDILHPKKLFSSLFVCGYKTKSNYGPSFFWETRFFWGEEDFLNRNITHRSATTNKQTTRKQHTTRFP